MIEYFSDNPTALRRVTQHYFNALDVPYFMDRDMEVLERGYSVLEYVFDPLTKEYLWNVDVPFDELESLPKENMHRFFRTVQQTLDDNNSLNYGNNSL